MSKKGKGRRLSPCMGLLLSPIREGGVGYTESGDTAVHLPVTASQAHTALLKPACPYSRPVSQAHTADGEGKRPLGWGLSRPFESSVGHRQPTVPGSGPSPPDTCCRLYSWAWSARRGYSSHRSDEEIVTVLNSQLRRQTSINIYDEKFHYLKIPF